MGVRKMLISRLIVTPTSETVQYLYSVFQNCPFDVDFSNLYVTLNEMDVNAVVRCNNTYTYNAQAGSLEYVYSDETESTSVVLPLVSDDLVARMQSVREEVGALYHPYPLAFMTIIPSMPPLSISYRHFVASVSDMLYNSDEVLQFTDEREVVVNINQVIPDDLYYKAQGL